MKDLYLVAGISKQALWKHNKHQAQVLSKTEQVVKIIQSVRKQHKRMGCRHMYYIDPEGSPVGRDIFESIGFSNGFRLKRLRSLVKTTWSQRIEYYPNLIEGKILNGINQVWQSDIFYIMSQGVHFYGVTIMDVYSRKLLALHISKSLDANQLVIAVKKAIRARGASDLTGCIFHSDRGSQYISKMHKELLAENKMKISMCTLPQENAYAERIQGTLKHDYIQMDELTEKNKAYIASKTMKLYNDERPHTSIGMISPSNFELYIERLLIKDRPKMPIFEWDHALLTKEELINKKKKVAKKKKLPRIIMDNN